LYFHSKLIAQKGDPIGQAFNARVKRQHRRVSAKALVVQQNREPGSGCTLKPRGHFPRMPRVATLVLVA